MRFNLVFRLFAFVVLVLVGVGCVPLRGTMPTTTWHPDEPNASCTAESLADANGPGWSRTSRKALVSKLERDEPAIVRVLGCTVDVLPHCNALTGEGDAQEIDAQSLDGDCAGATHVVRSASEEPFASLASDTVAKRIPPLSIAPLGLGDFDLSGTWSGTMRQPNGPYEVYNMVLEVAQHGDRVTGVSHLSTVDDVYWGELRFEGRVEGSTMFFADVEVVDDNLGMLLEWCAKGGYLLVDPREEQLAGRWRAAFCAPGTLDLQRQPERSAKAPEHDGRPRSNVGR